MVPIVRPREASPGVLSPLHSMLVVKGLPDKIENRADSFLYRIERVQKSESAWILFVRQEDTEESFVIKILYSYHDVRYCLETKSQRQQCQQEALRWNSFFSPEAYVGLAYIYDLQLPQLRLRLGPPNKELSDERFEYALVMRQLPDNRRLDFLLEHESDSMLVRCADLLTRRVFQIHRDLPPLSRGGLENWGSFDQLQLKLKHNLGLADPIFTCKRDYNSVDNKKLRAGFTDLRDVLQQVFTVNPYQDYCEQRITGENIKRCHGDLKGPNIWIEASAEEPALECVSVLDAIDFNPTYSYIDTLSDFAALIVDIRVRMKSPELVHRLTTKMIEDYLSLTGQNGDKAAEAVLNYYLVEKAYVFAAISLVYDEIPELGLRYLEAGQAFASRLLLTMDKTINTPQKVLSLI